MCVLPLLIGALVAHSSSSTSSTSETALKPAPWEVGFSQVGKKKYIAPWGDGTTTWGGAQFELPAEPRGQRERTASKPSNTSRVFGGPQNMGNHQLHNLPPRQNSSILTYRLFITLHLQSGQFPHAETDSGIIIPYFFKKNSVANKTR